MKTFLLASLSLILFCLNSCEKQATDSLICQTFTLNKTFRAEIGDVRCLLGTEPNSPWGIKFGPLMEDSRCNFPLIECIWIGRYVMGATIYNGNTVVKDTFFAENNWTDTIYQGGYQIILAKVYPEIRTTTDPLDTSEYSFDVIVK